MEELNNDISFMTHQIYTSKELSKLNKNAVIVELGIGNGSSPLMYEFCKNNPDSKVLSFESNSVWFEQIFEKYGNLPNYIFNLIEDWNELESHLNEKKYDLVFVDQSPWEARISSIDFLKDKTKVFILHDYDFYNKSENDWVLEPCNDIFINDETSWISKKYSEEFNFEDNYDTLPPTLVMKKKIKRKTINK